MPMVSDAALRRFHAGAALALALGMALTVGGALLFEHAGGYIPCKLCLEQRVPYYAGVPVMLAALLSARVGPPALTRLLLLAGGILMLWGAYLGAFHAGVEWGWWPGPTDCGAVAGGSVDTGGAGVLDAIDQVVPPSCDEAALRILGLSLAGWNALIALALGAAALWAAAKRYGSSSTSQYR